MKVPLIAAAVAGAVVAAAVGVAELLAAEFPLAGVFVALAFFVAAIGQKLRASRRGHLA